MTKTVLFYARSATERQNEVSIETQIELGEAFIKARGWKLVATCSDAAISGTSYESRPGIRSLMTHVKRERIDIVLCVTVDRLSRDLEHRTRIIDELRHCGADIWTVQADAPVTDIEMALRTALNDELDRQIDRSWVPEREYDLAPPCGSSATNSRPA